MTVRDGRRLSSMSAELPLRPWWFRVTGKVYNSLWFRARLAGARDAGIAALCGRRVCDGRVNHWWLEREVLHDPVTVLDHLVSHADDAAQDAVGQIYVSHNMCTKIVPVILCVICWRMFVLITIYVVNSFLLKTFGYSKRTFILGPCRVPDRWIVYPVPFCRFYYPNLKFYSNKLWRDNQDRQKDLRLEAAKHFVRYGLPTKLSRCDDHAVDTNYTELSNHATSWKQSSLVRCHLSLGH